MEGEEGEEVELRLVIQPSNSEVRSHGTFHLLKLHSNITAPHLKLKINIWLCGNLEFVISQAQVRF